MPQPPTPIRWNAACQRRVKTSANRRGLRRLVVESSSKMGEVVSVRREEDVTAFVSYMAANLRVAADKTGLSSPDGRMTSPPDASGNGTRRKRNGLRARAGRQRWEAFPDVPGAIWAASNCIGPTSEKS